MTGGDKAKDLGYEAQTERYEPPPRGAIPMTGDPLVRFDLLDRAMPGTSSPRVLPTRQLPQPSGWARAAGWFVFGLGCVGAGVLGAALVEATVLRRWFR